MKPHMNPQGNGKWAKDGRDKVKRKFRRIFSKSARQISKLQTKKYIFLIMTEEEKLNVCEAIEHYGFTDTFVDSRSFEDIQDAKFQALIKNFVEAHSAISDYVGYGDYLKNLCYSAKL